MMDSIMSGDARAAIWRRAIGEHGKRLGLALSSDVLEELIAYLEDVYDASRRDGASDDEAMAIVRHAIDQANYEELAPRQRARAADSRLLFRDSPSASMSGV